MAIVEFTIVPLGTKDTSLSKYVADCHKVLDDVKNMIQNRYVPYDHKVDKKDLNLKWDKNVKVPLIKIDSKYLPKYLIENKDKYFKWFD